MSTAKALIFPVVLLVILWIRRWLTDQIVQWQIATAPIPVGVKRGRMGVIVRKVLADHESMTGTIRNGTDFHWPLERLAEEDASATQIVVAIVVPTWIGCWSWLFIFIS